MPTGTHLYRRKAIYYWRRRLPTALQGWSDKRYFFLSLETPEPTFARRLVTLLDAKLEEVVTAIEHQELHISPAQLNEVLRAVVTKHLYKLERMSAAAKSFENFDASQAARDDKRSAWAYRLLHGQGRSAFVRSVDEEAMTAEGLTEREIDAVRDHLHMLRINNLIPTRRDILGQLLEDAGGQTNEANLSRVQDVYFRGMYIALRQSERRYDGYVAEADDVADEVLRQNAHASSPSSIVPNCQWSHSPVVRPSHELELTVSSADSEAIDDRFETITKLLVKKRSKAERWSDKSKRQAEQTYSLLAKFMKEERGIEHMNAVRQKDLAALVSFFETEIYKHYGKSERDRERSISELRMIALSKPENLRGLEAGTLNRHLTFISQLFDLAEAEGADLDPRLKIGKLRAVDSSDERERDERLKLSLDRIGALFDQPPFNNCLSWKHQDQEGSSDNTLVFHGALYFIPMLMFYGGGRREEYCGLMIEDVILANGPHPYLHIAKNKYRRIKNGQSKRNIVLHPELIRLGILDYVEAIKSLGYDLVFPDLFSPSTRSPLGNRFYKIFKPVLINAGISEEGLGSHAIRHAFGGILKKRDVSEEHRADLLGHAGKTETSERYCEATEIEKMYRLICKMPKVTEGLTALPLSLPDWLINKQAAPFSQPTRSKVAKQRVG